MSGTEIKLSVPFLTVPATVDTSLRTWARQRANTRADSSSRSAEGRGGEKSSPLNVRVTRTKSSKMQRLNNKTKFQIKIDWQMQHARRSKQNQPPISMKQAVASQFFFLLLLLGFSSSSISRYCACDYINQNFVLCPDSILRSRMSMLCEIRNEIQGSRPHAICAGFEVVTAPAINVAIFWDIQPCSPYVNRRFGGTYYLHLQGRKSAEQETSEHRVVIRSSEMSVKPTLVESKGFWRWCISLRVIGFLDFVHHPEL
jgi:hypothetical protein